MQVSRQQAESILNGVLGLLPDEHGAGCEFAEEESLVGRITFATNPATVELHQVVEDECYAIVTYNTRTSRPVIHNAWMLGYTGELNHPDFCVATRRVILERHACEGCEFIERVWDRHNPQKDDYNDRMVDLILTDVEFALTMC